jgi:hypothetical protein
MGWNFTLHRSQGAERETEDPFEEGNRKVHTWVDVTNPDNH